MLFRLWESVNSYMYDDRMLQFIANLAEMHVDPTISDPKKIQDIPDDAKSEDEARPHWSDDSMKFDGPWPGLYKDSDGVGIFSDHEVSLIVITNMDPLTDVDLIVASYYVQMLCING